MPWIKVEPVLWMRARRAKLDPTAPLELQGTAQDVLGAQAQQEKPALWALAMRTAGGLRDSEVRAELMEEPRTLVRTWGQRGTLHIYAKEDWRDVVAMQQEWGPGGRRGAMPPEELILAAGEVAEREGVVTRAEVMPVLTAGYVDECRRRIEEFGGTHDPERFGAGRLLWQLAHRGAVCVAGKRGQEQEYAARSAWFPGLEWPEEVDSREAAVRFTRRYLKAHAPATAADVAHFFGAKVTDAREWLAELEAAGELIGVECEGREGLVALAEDEEALKEEPPEGFREWPVRLLPMWDTLLMGHKDKSWTVPVEAERKVVWGKAAMVRPVVLARGRVVATWSHKPLSKRVRVEVQPLSGWRKGKHLSGVKREAKAFARHLGRAEAEVTVA